MHESIWHWFGIRGFILAIRRQPKTRPQEAPVNSDPSRQITDGHGRMRWLLAANLARILNRV